MYFSKNEVIQHRLSKSPRISYVYATEIIRRINIFLSSVALSLIIAATYVFLTEVHLEREAYFVKSTGEFRLIDYSKEVREKAIKIFYEK
ncbi:hypothetical protein EA58_19725 [Photobacterium galatheae]|uniref:Uncharacterized protein n=1 Tax=Photobacterium galatheae TaxID=1654360 RepID=A0A066RLG0_9GAMM|nr:hypothetical protein EA58_19725 [Photobacterium galatheae]